MPFEFDELLIWCVLHKIKFVVYKDDLCVKMHIIDILGLQTNEGNIQGINSGQNGNDAMIKNEKMEK